MSTSIATAVAAIERLVFNGTRPIVVALTGGWGEGKTYFWQNTVVPKFRDKKPAYVSIFGAESMTVIRERVVLACLPQIEGEKAGRIPAAIRSLKAPFIQVMKRLSDYWGERIGMSASVGVELMQSYALKTGEVVCIDDIERRSPDVHIESLLGFIAELRDKWGMKVVLIYNRRPLEAEESAFSLYQEKVIDRSIPFSMDNDAVVDLVFSDSKTTQLNVADAAKEYAAKLGLRNIRIVAKARNYFEEVGRALGSNADSEYLKAVLSSVFLFTAVRYAHPPPAGTTFEKLKSYNAFVELAKKGKSGENQDELDAAERMGNFLERYGYRHTDELDLLLIDLVESDVLNEPRLRGNYSEYKEKSSKSLLRGAVERVIDEHYHGTMKANCERLTTALASAVEPLLPYVQLGELDFYLTVLTTCGKEEEANRLFGLFKDDLGKRLKPDDDNGVGYRGFGYAPLRDFLIEVFEADLNDKRSLEEVAKSAFGDEFIRGADSDRFSKFSVEEIAEYFRTHDQPHLTTKLRMLVRDSNVETRAKAQAAAEILANSSPISRMRLQGMGIVKPQEPKAEL